MLKARFIHMFAGPATSLEFYQGWFPIAVGLCVEIDRVLGEYRKSFHWVQIKEKFGVMCLYFDLQGAPRLLCKSLQVLVPQAELESAQCCMACAEASRLSRQSGWMVTVCEIHEPDKMRKRGGRFMHELTSVPEQLGSTP